MRLSIKLPNFGRGRLLESAFPGPIEFGPHKGGIVFLAENECGLSCCLGLWRLSESFAQKAKNSFFAVYFKYCSRNGNFIVRFIFMVICNCNASPFVVVYINSASWPIYITELLKRLSSWRNVLDVISCPYGIWDNFTSFARSWLARDRESFAMTPKFIKQGRNGEFPNIFQGDNWRSVSRVDVFFWIEKKVVSVDPFHVLIGNPFG